MTQSKKTMTEEEASKLAAMVISQARMRALMDDVKNKNLSVLQMAAMVAGVPANSEALDRILIICNLLIEMGNYFGLSTTNPNKPDNRAIAGFTNTLLKVKTPESIRFQALVDTAVTVKDVWYFFLDETGQNSNVVYVSQAYNEHFFTWQLAMDLKDAAPGFYLNYKSYLIGISRAMKGQ